MKAPRRGSAAARQTLRRAALSAAAALAALIGYEGGASYLRAQIFQPDRDPLRPMTVAGVAFDILTVARGGESLTGLLARGERPGKAVALYLHGNGGSAAKGAAEAAGLVGAGYDLVVADYRGYGGNAGEPSEVGILEDAGAFLDRARAMADGRPLLLIGHSLGGAVAILLAAAAPVSGLLTIGAVARVSDLVPAYGRPFLRDGFDALSAADRVTAPWIIAHGEEDDVVPASDAVRLAGAPARAGRELHLLTGQDHAVAAPTLIALVDRLFARAARR